MTPKFTAGTLVRRTSAALRSMGMYTQPVNGRVEGYEGKWAKVRWSDMTDTEEPMLCADAGLELATRRGK